MCTLSALSTVLQLTNEDISRHCDRHSVYMTQKSTNDWVVQTAVRLSPRRTKGANGIPSFDSVAPTCQVQRCGQSVFCSCQYVFGSGQLRPLLDRISLQQQLTALVPLQDTSAFLRLGHNAKQTESFSPGSNHAYIATHVAMQDSNNAAAPAKCKHSTPGMQ